MNETRRRIINLVSDVTQATFSEVEAAHEFARLPQWDSLMHLRLVLAAEAEFATRFDIQEVSTIASIDSFASLVENKMAEAGHQTSGIPG